MPPAISLQRLTKRYGRVQALRDATLDVAVGEIFGFLGSNGAGKTTTIRLLLDLLRPTSGRAEIFGLDCRTCSLEVRRNVGYLPGELTLVGDMSGLDLLDLLGRMSGGSVNLARRAALLEIMALSHADLRRRIREYSTGMRRKLGIVQAMQHAPRLLTLDEPTDGLDPLMQEAFYELLRQEKARGATVFLSSHILAEVERTCERIALLKDGEIILTGPVSEVRALAPRTVRIHFLADVPAPSLSADYELVELSARSWCVRTRGELQELMAAAAGWPVRDVEIDTPRLEDAVVGYYRGGGS